MVNRVILIGNLGRDPEVRTLESGAMVAKFPVATNESYKDKNGDWQDVTEWHDIIAWRTLADRAQSQLKKGTMVYIEGKLTHRTWQDQDGKNRKTTEVVANYFRQINRRDGAGGQNFPSDDNEYGVSSEDSVSYATESDADNATEADDDLPF